MKKRYLIITITLLLVFAFWFVWSDLAQAPSGESPTLLQDTATSTSPLIVTAPLAGQSIASPLKIIGLAPGAWFFEASFPVKLYDKQGKLLGQGVMQAQSDWMTEKMVPFEGELNFQSSVHGEAELVFEKDNPSGLPENEASWSLPLIVAPSEKKTILKNYFLNDRLDPEISCTKAWPLERSVPQTSAVASSALASLLSGPIEEEKAQGYYSSIPVGTRVQSLSIVDGLAKVDFSAELDRGVAGSCLVSAIRTQIEMTLKQFPTVKEVSITVDGRSEEILQP